MTAETLDIRIYRGDHFGAQSVAIAPYPFNGNHQNTGPRLQRVAELAEIDIIGFPRPGTGVWPPDRQLRQDMTAYNFDFYNEQISDAVVPHINHYDKVLAWGDSTASYSIGPVIMASAVPFTHALFRDGINHRAPQLPIAGEFRYFRYQLQDERHKPMTYEDEAVFYPMEVDMNLSRIISSTAHTAAEIYTYSPLWRSTFSQQMLQRIAQQHPDLPIYNVSLGHTFTGTPAQAMDFDFRLAQIRSQHKGSNVAQVVTNFKAEWYHSDLESPSKAALCILGSLSLASFVRRS